MINPLVRYYSNSRLGKKMKIAIVGVAGLVLITLLTIISIESRSIVLRISEQSIVNQSKENSYRAVDFINMKQSSLKTLVNCIEMQSSSEISTNLLNSTIEHLNSEDHDIYAIWCIIESKDSTKAVKYITSKDGSGVQNQVSNLIETQFGYRTILSKQEPYISNPVDINGTWTFCIAEPIKKNGKAIGVIGYVIKSEDLVSITKSAMNSEDGFCKIISHDGIIVAHPEKSSIGSKTDDGTETDSIIERIRHKEFFTNYVHSTTYNGMAYKVFVPITPEGSKNPWSFCTVVPMTKMVKDIRLLTVICVLLIIIGIVVLILLTSFISNRISKPIIYTSKQLKLLSQGRLKQIENVDISRNDEIGEMITALNELSASQKHLARFATEVGNGNLDINIDIKNEEDIIGKSMVEMKQNLIEARSVELKRKAEEELRNWKITGNARIHELVRKENSNINRLCTIVLQEVISYSNAIQGGIFVIDDTDQSQRYVDLVACIAYSRSKMAQKRMPVEEGLIGRCIFEKAPIILKEIPQNYLEITSGLGDRNPNFLAIIPLINNDEITGVLEVASFNEMGNDTVEYLTKSAESLASALSNVKINERTQRLLEQSKLFAEEMSAQEEELRQNMEEMQAAQEEMYRKTYEYEETIANLKKELEAYKGTSNSI